MTTEHDPGRAFRDELDPLVRAAVDEMTSRSLDERLLSAAMDRLRRATPPSPSSLPSPPMAIRWRRRWGLVGAAAASLCLLWLGAQTQTWGRVAQGFQRAAPKPTFAMDMNPDAQRMEVAPPVGAGLRFILLLHVGSLTLGLLGFVATWIWRMGRWLRFLVRGGAEGRRGERVCVILHRAALGAYGGGVALGCVWAKANWGRLWSWDVREASGLLTLGIATMWILSRKRVSVGAAADSAHHDAFLATLAMGMISLLYLFGALYGHTRAYGMRSLAPDIVAGFFGLQLFLVAALRWRMRRRAVNPVVAD